MSDAASWEGFHYEPLSRTDSALADRLAVEFVNSFAEAALLAQPNRKAISAELELDGGSDAEGHRAIRVGFRLTGSRQAAEWDGTADDAKAFVMQAARATAESLAADPHEDHDWRSAFECAPRDSNPEPAD